MKIYQNLIVFTDSKSYFYSQLCYSESGSSVLCKLKDYLKIDFHDWMIVQILLCYLLTSDSNVASFGWSV